MFHALLQLLVLNHSPDSRRLLRQHIAIGNGSVLSRRNDRIADRSKLPAEGETGRENPRCSVWRTAAFSPLVSSRGPRFGDDIQVGMSDAGDELGLTLGDGRDVDQIGTRGQGRGARLEVASRRADRDTTRGNKA